MGLSGEAERNGPVQPGAEKAKESACSLQLPKGGYREAKNQAPLGGGEREDKRQWAQAATREMLRKKNLAWFSIGPGFTDCEILVLEDFQNAAGRGPGQLYLALREALHLVGAEARALLRPCTTRTIL